MIYFTCQRAVWTITAPPCTARGVRLHDTALPDIVVRRARYRLQTLTDEHIHLPHRHMTYGALFDCIAEFYAEQFDEYTEFAGIVVVRNALILNLDVKK